MDLQEWFTADSLGALAIATVALRIWIEVTKNLVDTGLAYVHVKVPTQLYAFIAAGVLSFYLNVGGDPVANLFNTALLVALTKVMDLD